MTLPHKGKMLWCSYFRSFIKLTNFSRTGNFIEKLNFISTPWKIKIPPQPHHQPHPSDPLTPAPPPPSNPTSPYHHPPILQPPTMGKKWGLNFSRTGNFIKILNSISTPWKIKIPPQPHHEPHPSDPPTPSTHPTTTHLTLPLPTHREKLGPQCLIFHGLLHIVYPFGRQLLCNIKYMQ